MAGAAAAPGLSNKGKKGVDRGKEEGGMEEERGKGKTKAKGKGRLRSTPILLMLSCAAGVLHQGCLPA